MTGGRWIGGTQGEICRVASRARPPREKVAYKLGICQRSESVYQRVAGPIRRPHARVPSEGDAMRALTARGLATRACVLAATLLSLVARVYSRPLGVGTVSGIPVASRLLDVDGAARETGSLRASDARDDVQRARHGVERAEPVEPVRMFTGATTAQQVIDFLHEAVPGYPSAFPPAADAATAVPRVLHVSWATHALPAFARTYLETWRSYHPTWRVARWTDATMRDFVRLRFPERLAAYDAFPAAVNRADVFRYMVLFEIGGLYVDLDVEALRSLEPLLYDSPKRDGDDVSWRARAACLVGQEPHAHAVVLARDERAADGARFRACNAVMASAPGSTFWQTVLDEVEHRARVTRVTRWNPPTITGPQALTSALERTGFDAEAGGCGVADPPDALFPAMDKSQFALARATCEDAGFLVADRERAARACPARALRVSTEDAGAGDEDGGRDDAETVVERIRVGAPGEVPDLRRACCELSREGFVNPPREAMVRRGAFTVHHWVHTWLDGPDARLSNAWRRRALSSSSR